MTSVSTLSKKALVIKSNTRLAREQTFSNLKIFKLVESWPTQKSKYKETNTIIASQRVYKVRKF
jgi:hypothetical protein